MNSSPTPLRCYPAVGLDTDHPFWVSKSSFNRHFDQTDFMCRSVHNVVDAYLANWFHRDAAGKRYFTLPPVSVIRGSTQFISGRHRTAVLLRHLEQVPLSFDFRHILDADRTWLQSVVTAPIDLSTEIALPDLPVKVVLP